MHVALLIDEIVRQILDYSRGDLSSLAQTCRALLPASLDILWRDLVSISCLIRLIEGVDYKDGLYVLDPTVTTPNLDIFHSYASRVKSVAHRQDVRFDDRLFAFLNATANQSGRALIPHLVSTSFRASSYSSLQTVLSVSTTVKFVDIDIGFTGKTVSRSQESATKFIYDLERSGAHLDCLNIRGSATERLNILITHIKSLNRLSLRLGHTLSPETLLGIGSLPFLGSLDVQASHILADNIRGPWNLLSRFTKLRDLRIRVKIDLLVVILPPTLESLWIELEDPIMNQEQWISLMRNIGELHNLTRCTVQHHSCLDSLPGQPIAISASSSNLDNGASHSSLFRDIIIETLPFTVLHRLSNLHGLRQLTLDTTTPINLRNEDVSIITKWWPNLEHLDLGCSIAHAMSSTIDLSGLDLLLNGVLALQTLVISVGPEWSYVDPPVSLQFCRFPLRRLTLGTSSPPDVQFLSSYLRRFTSLAYIDGSPEFDRDWDLIATTHRLQTYSENWSVPR